MIKTEVVNALVVVTVKAVVLRDVLTVELVFLVVVKRVS